MSQKKVDAYKAEKANREKIMKKEKLILTGTVGKLEKQMVSLSRFLDEEEELLPLGTRIKAKNYWAFVLPALVRHRAMSELLGEYGILMKKQKGIYDDVSDFVIKKVTVRQMTEKAVILQAGNLQHVAHEPRQPPHLRGDQLHIVPLLRLRDRAVEHTVQIARDGRHRRFQLVADIGHEFLPRGVGILLKATASSSISSVWQFVETRTFRLPWAIWRAAAAMS